jgi:NAD(P)-dependent dehydrogenase (short-subunit alcohol dehydrogenase family)
MLLEGKNAVVYGAAGAVGGAVSRAFAREGARVFLAGRTRATLDRVAGEIAAAGGAAEAGEVDALDERAVERHADAVAEQAGSVDVSLNAVGLDNGEQAIPLVELSADDYVRPIEEYARVHFVTAKAAARHMTRQGSGVILPLSVPMARVPAASSGSFGMAGAAVEAFSRQLAAELGPHGVRVVCLRPTGIPETATRLGSRTREVWGRAAERMGIPLEELLELVGGGSPLRRALTVDEVADVAAFVASDRASGMTGTVANVTMGAVVD